jgi:hypothetical protein
VVNKLRTESEKALQLLHERDGAGAGEGSSEALKEDEEEKLVVGEAWVSEWELQQVASKIKAFMGVGAT